MLFRNKILSSYIKVKIYSENRVQDMYDISSLRYYEPCAGRLDRLKGHYKNGLEQTIVEFTF